ncbi:MAG: lipopolysaccharide biosynthesis protein RfbH [Elusimicrobia bacterium CG08_land_8_20_14_0_20_59_10]|nr:MAG: lipopolysaccharide biosynthesis protein RfbH [Elusimicrobia bacterium CG08_land_8_20_14_0_20_59_10]
MKRDEILKAVKAYHSAAFPARPFDREKDTVRYAGRVFDEKELAALVDSSLDFWLTEGRYSESFAEKLSDLLEVDNVLLTNSGSSSNLLALSALTSKKMGKKRLVAGDEVITVAAGFPSTVTPILQNGLVPVFVDVELPTYNINVEALKKAVSPKTRAIFLAHTLGNPFNLDEVLKVVKQHDLWLIEDNCDALGSRYKGKYTGTFGHLATFSFYPAHHITTGEGGAVATNSEQLAQIVRSFRDWGRDCYCTGGENNTCGKRFSQQFGTLPPGYDHKYVYSEIGYNLKMTDMQAAIGSVQMDKLESFGEKRRANFKRYQKIFANYEQFFILTQPTPGADPSWFTYVLSVRENAPFTRNELVTFLNECRIETRNIFAGNILRQPAFIGRPCRVAGELTVTDFIMNNTFFLGTFPGMTEEMFSYVEDCVAEFLGRFVK